MSDATPDQLRDLLKRGSLSQRAAAFMLEIKERKFRRMCAGQLEIPTHVMLALREYVRDRMLIANHTPLDIARYLFRWSSEHGHNLTRGESTLIAMHLLKLHHGEIPSWRLGHTYVYDTVLFEQRMGCYDIRVKGASVPLLVIRPDQLADGMLQLHDGADDEHEG